MKFFTQPTGWQTVLVLTIGILAVSTAAVLVRLATREAQLSAVGFSLVLAASRLIIASGVLLPTWQTIRRNPPTRSAWRYATAAGVALAAHFATWITSLSYTSIAASTTIVTTTSIWVALLSWRWFGEKPNRVTLAGIAIALIGGITIGWQTSEATGTNPLLGNGLALVGAWTASLYLLLGREAQRRDLDVRSYVTIAYSVAAIVLLPLPLLAGASYTGYSPLTYGLILLMAIVPQLIGHTSLNWAVCWVSPTLVSVLTLFEPVASSGLALVLFGEVPGIQVLIGAMILLIGVAISIAANR
ncbi:EamA/RhaT family transporter [Phormidesmis priestleyi ULC007]|uniref:EamA/RhaT family transporter n=1 Tax=Phormidesmis priestleyi ULC007 TaxID=1920490 RepID=A0A2T1DJD5_9CYAN|nr:DMT family transporter [Phormidesmis priestleyi]PSB20571.1 EamA/RhaT family transporter [Phormidesmis priestleyi ULC007]PZO54241.1 MAG: EamA/RhaT family transporter [Phormidesmis priestleyi]